MENRITSKGENHFCKIHFWANWMRVVFTRNHLLGMAKQIEGVSALKDLQIADRQSISVFCLL